MDGGHGHAQGEIHVYIYMCVLAFFLVENMEMRAIGTDTNDCAVAISHGLGVQQLPCCYCYRYRFDRTQTPNAGNAYDTCRSHRDAIETLQVSATRTRVQREAGKTQQTGRGLRRTTALFYPQRKRHRHTQGRRCPCRRENISTYLYAYPVQSRTHPHTCLYFQPRMAATSGYTNSRK